MTKVGRLVLVGLVSIIGAPAAVFAQASISGVVKDTSGAALPGVTVEAASAALIERVRSVVTDGAGQYQIIDLRPGTYAVTFSLGGFTPLKRDGIELTGAFAATINAELRVGGINETITVSGETPVVDVRSVSRQRVMTVAAKLGYKPNLLARTSRRLEPRKSESCERSRWTSNALHSASPPRRQSEGR